MGNIKLSPTVGETAYESEENIAFRKQWKAKRTLEGRVNSAELSLTPDAIMAIVNASSTITEMSAELEIQAGQIATKVSATDLATQLTNYSTITQTATEIATRVATTDYNGNAIASMINQTATTIKLSAEKIELSGFVEIVDLTDGVTSISGGNIKTGNISATTVTIGGWKLTASTIWKGAIKFDAANERLYINTAAYLYAIGDTGSIGLSGGLVATGSISAIQHSSNSGDYSTTYGASGINSSNGGSNHGLTLNGSKIMTAANFSLSGTTLTISTT